MPRTRLLLPVLCLLGSALAVLPLLAGNNPVVVDPSFAGIGLHQQAIDIAQTAWPPSPSSAVGPNHVLELMNQSVAIFTRSGTRLQHLRLRDFLNVTAQGIKYQATFDPQVVFDSRTGRWFAACVGAGAGTNALPDPVILAVSKNSDPTGSWSKFLVPLGEAGAANDFKATGNLAFGVDDVGVYFGVRIFPEVSAEFAKIAATPKSSLVASHPALGTVTQFPPINGVLASPQPASSPGVGASGAGWFVASADTGANLRWWKVTWNHTTPTLAGSGELTAPAFGALPDAAQSGSATPIETGDARVVSAVIRNGHLWTARTIGVNATGGASSPNRTACEWFDLDVSGATPSLVQTGRVFEPGGSPRSYCFPTISANSAGDALLSFCGSQATEFIGAYFAGRLHTDATGTMSAVQTLKAGEATYVRTVGDDTNPFGRHGSVSIDPEDDFSFWSVQPYAASTPTPNAWGTWIGRLQLSEPPLPPGEARISPTALKFGKVKVGKSKTKTFTLTSQGDHPLVGSVGSPTGPYTVTAGGGAFQLVPRQKLKVTVRFAPIAAGAAPAASVPVTTNDPTKPQINIPLIGTGK